VLGASRDFLLIAVLVSAVLGFLWVTGAGHLSDRIGRKKMYIIDCLFVAVFGFVYFAMLDTKVPALMFIAMAVSALPIMTMNGPEAALIAESFSPRLRYSGTSLGYRLASIIAGGLSLFIARAVCSLRFELSDRPLHPRLRGDRYRCHVAAYRLHRQRHLGRI
jgi:MFS family permease